MAGDVPTRYSEQELQIAADHFNAVTPENCMKPERIHPEEDQWEFDRSDTLVDWAEQHKMSIHGHTLVWHAQTRDWFFRDGDNEETGRTENLRDSKWMKTIGPESLTLAFWFAHEADPNAILDYNDYSIESGPNHAERDQDEQGENGGF
jgi:GH35 family endo-1,4-beta-xylanase